ncbi:GGDEF domain-containing protein [Betaproteobacteria bacterium]|nr:GGDEF domain-containing protein [Betaproteobacteria bacterium]
MSPFWNKVLQRIVGPTELTPEQCWQLVMPFGRSPYSHRYAASVIIARVQFISFIFAILVPLWAIVDLLVFELHTALWLLAMRMSAGIGFACLALPREMSLDHPYRQALIMLVTLMLIPSAFYLASLMVLHPETTVGFEAVMIRFYAFMPIIVLGGLAIFPLTILEIVLLSLPMLGAALIGLMLKGMSLPFEEHVIALWCMLMMTGVSIFSGMSQSLYMETLVRRVMTDPLTGTFSRRSGSETLELIFNLSKTTKQSLALAFFDLDHFKRINDTFGHEAGDKTLQQAVTHLRAALRQGDTLVRWGGEEFVVILPNMAANQLQGFIARLTDHGLGETPDGHKLTVSVGIAERIADKINNWQTLIEVADRRMYQAKHQGRHRAVLPGDVVIMLGEDPKPQSPDES